MNFRPHYDLRNKHAFLGASQSSWLRYDDEKLRASYRAMLARERGTKMHELAASLIKMGVRLPRKQITINMYVNDAIGFGMTPEQPLYYSDNCFGTADAIKFDKNLLRIHDLKTGETPASLDQLLIYAALFCLEYEVRPTDIGAELRIYQFDDVVVGTPTSDDILLVMDKIVRFDKLVAKLKTEEA